MSPEPVFPEVARVPPEVEERLRTLPKVELHQHVDGSIPAEVTWELMRHYRLHPADSLPEMRRFLEIQEGEEGTLLAYLDKMHYPLWVTQFYENVSKVVEAIGLAAAAAGVQTLELRYAPLIYTYAGLTPRQSIRAALSGLATYELPNTIFSGLEIEITNLWSTGDSIDIYYDDGTPVPVFLQTITVNSYGKYVGMSGSPGAWVPLIL